MATGAVGGVGAQMRRGARLVGGGLIGAVLAAPLSAQVAVDPLAVVVRDTSVHAIRLFNPDAVTAQVTVSRGDWERDGRGATRWAALGTHARSCGKALRVNQDVLSIPPQSSAVVQVSVRDPQAIQRGCWAAVHFDMDVAAGAGATRGATIRYQVRRAVKVTAFREDAEARLTAEPLTYVPGVAGATDSTAQDAVVLRLRNVGAQQVSPRVRIEWLRADGGRRHQDERALVPMLPEAVLESRLPLPTLPAGTYALLVRVDWGSEAVVVRRLTVQVGRP